MNLAALFSGPAPALLRCTFSLTAHAAFVFHPNTEFLEVEDDGVAAMLVRRCARARHRILCPTACTGDSRCSIAAHEITHAHAAPLSQDDSSGCARCARALASEPKRRAFHLTREPRSLNFRSRCADISIARGRRTPGESTEEIGPPG